MENNKILLSMKMNIPTLWLLSVPFQDIDELWALSFNDTIMAAFENILPIILIIIDSCYRLVDGLDLINN